MIPPSKQNGNKASNPFTLNKMIKYNPIFETTVDESKKLTKFNSYGKAMNDETSSILNSNNPTSSSSNKNKIGSSRYSHVFGDNEEERLMHTKIETTRSAASTRASKFSSNKRITPVNPTSNTEVDEANQNVNTIVQPKNHHFTRSINTMVSKFSIKLV